MKTLPRHLQKIHDMSGVELNHNFELARRERAATRMISLQRVYERIMQDIQAEVTRREHAA